MSRPRGTKSPHKTGKSAMYRAMKVGESIYVLETMAKVSGIVNHISPPKTFKMELNYLFDKNSMKISKIIKVTKMKDA